MSKKFYNITDDEMHAFLTSLGFVQLNLPNTRELVYGKIMVIGNFADTVDSDGGLIRSELIDTITLSTRVYTAINPSGSSRESGKDAIRVQNFWKLNGEPKPVGMPVKCLRIDTWKKNLEKAIEKARDIRSFRVCKNCGSPMVIRKRKNDNREFWGCAAFPYTKCKNVA